MRRSDRPGRKRLKQTPPARPHLWYTIALAVLLAATLLVRYVALDMDPPYDIISRSGTFLTDEGWYSKSALLFVRFGEWTNEFDPVWRSHTALFTLIQAASFGMFGTSVFVMRALSVTAFGVSIVAFYNICRTTQPRNVALVSCLLVSVTLQTFAFSRMALIEPLGTMVCLIALLVWVRGGGRWWTAPLSMAIILTAPFVKVAFLYAVVALALLNLSDAWKQWREGRRRDPLVTLACVLLAPLIYKYFQDLALAWAGADGTVFKQNHVTSRIHAISGGFLHTIRNVVVNESKMGYKLVYATGARALMAMLAFGGIFVFLKQRISKERVLNLSRASKALSLWLLGGASCFGLFPDQPPRYFFFALFPLVYLTVTVVREICGARHWRLSCLFLLFVHTTIQGEGYALWLSRDELYTYRDCAEDLVDRIKPRKEGEPIVLMGGASAFLALYDERIRPLSFNHHDDLLERVTRWKPRYVVCWKEDAYFLKTKCPGVVTDIEFIQEYPLLRNYYYGRPHVLYEIEYR